MDVNINTIIVFLAGLMSFFTPCILPIIPAFLGHIAGFSFEEVTDVSKIKIVRKKAFIAGLGFSLGFFIVTVLIFGSISALISSINYDVKNWLRIIMGAIIILISLSYFGLYQITPLMKERRIRFNDKITNSAGFFVSILIGGAFVLGWSPCLGPIIGSVMMMTGLTEVSKAMIWWYLAVYAFGLILPFIIVTLSMHWFVKFLPKLNKKIKYFEWFAGLMLLIMGIILISNKMDLIVMWGTSLANIFK